MKEENSPSDNDVILVSDEAESPEKCLDSDISLSLPSKEIPSEEPSTSENSFKVKPEGLPLIYEDKIIAEKLKKIKKRTRFLEEQLRKNREKELELVKIQNDRKHLTDEWKRILELNAECMRKEEEERQKHKEERRKREEEKMEKKRIRDEERRKRLAAIEAKSEEKRRKEEEKKKLLEKTRDSFMNFFTPIEPALKKEPKQVSGFRAFEIQQNMRLAPISRITIPQDTAAFMKTMDKILQKEDYHTGYLQELKYRKPRTSLRTFPMRGDEDAVILDDSSKSLKWYKVKFFQFDSKYHCRPPYYGTWRKRSDVIKPRNPFAKDTKFFDYNVDSDEEWEDEEPGDVITSSDEMETSSDEGAEEADDFFVPHGYLSESECSGSETGEALEEIQVREKCKYDAWYANRKNKFKKLVPRCIGTIWKKSGINERESETLESFKLMFIEYYPDSDQKKSPTKLAKTQEDKSSDADKTENTSATVKRVRSAVPKKRKINVPDEKNLQPPSGATDDLDSTDMQGCLSSKVENQETTLHSRNVSPQDEKKRRLEFFPPEAKENKND